MALLKSYAVLNLCFFAKFTVEYQKKDFMNVALTSKSKRGRYDPCMTTGNQHLNVQAEGGSSGVEILTFRHQACFFTFPLVWSAFVISTAIRTALKEA